MRPYRVSSDSEHITAIYSFNSKADDDFGGCTHPATTYALCRRAKVGHKDLDH